MDGLAFHVVNVNELTKWDEVLTIKTKPHTTQGKRILKDELPILHSLFSDKI